MQSSIRSRVALAAGIVVLLVGAAAFYVTDRAYKGVLATVATGTVDDGQRAFDALRATRAENINVAIDMLAGDEGILAALLAGDRERLLRLTRPRFETLRDSYGVSRMYFYSPDASGTVFLRTYLEGEALDTSAFGDASGSAVLAHARQTGSAQSGFEVGRSALSLRVIAPLEDRSGALIGYVGLAQQVNDYLQAVSERTGDDYALYLSKNQLERDAWARVQDGLGRADTWDRYSDVVLADNTMDGVEPDASFVPGELSDQPRLLGLVSREDSLYSAGAFPIRNAEGETVGEVYVQRDLSELALTLRRNQIALVIAFVVLATVAALIAAFVVDRLVFRRMDGLLSRLEHMSLAAAAGRWEGLPADQPFPADEIGRFEKFFSGLMTVISTALRGREHDEEDP